MSWIVTFTSAAALMICIREVVIAGLQVWQSRRSQTLEYWLEKRDLCLDHHETRELVLSNERFHTLLTQLQLRSAGAQVENTNLRYLGIMLGLGCIAALGTMFGLLTIG